MPQRDPSLDSRRNSLHGTNPLRVTPKRRSASALGRRLADKLVKVWRADGAEAWVLIHVEVQAQSEADFVRRMYTYNYRLFDRYNRQIASLAVLSDEDLAWRPQEFSYTLFGCEEKHMTYISSIERRALKRGMERGMEQGMQQGMQKEALLSRRETLLDILAVRFGGVPESLQKAISSIVEVPRVKQLLRNATTAGSLAEFQAALEGLS